MIDQHLLDEFTAQSSKCDAELLTLMYGALIAELVSRETSMDDINQTLFELGDNAGASLADDCLSKIEIPQMDTFENVSSLLSCFILKAYFGAEVIVKAMTPAGVVLEITDLPLMNGVVIPAHLSTLKYTNFLAGVISSVLDAVQLVVKTEMSCDNILTITPVKECRGHYYNLED